MRSNIKFRFIVVNTMIIFLVIALIYVLLYFISVREYRGYIDKNTHQITQQVASVIDNRVLEQALKLPHRYFSASPLDDELRQPMVRDIRVKKTAILDVSNRVKSILAKNPFIIGMDIYYERNSLLFIDGAMKDLSDVANRHLIYPKWFIEKDSHYEMAYFSGTEERVNGQKVTSYIYRVPLGDVDYETIVAIHIDISALQNMLRTMRNEEKHTEFAIIDMRSQIITYTGEESRDMMLQNIYSYIEANEKKGIFRFDWKGHAYMVSMAESQYGQWYYLALMPMEGFYVLSFYMVIALLAPLFMLIVSIPGAVLANSKIYKPMDTLFSFIYNLPGGSSNDTEKKGDECEVLTSKLSDFITVNQPAIFHSTIRRLLTGDLVLNHEREYLEAGIKFNHRNFYCMIVDIYWEEEQQSSLGRIYELMDELKSNETYALYPIVEDHKIYILVNDEDLTREEEIIGVVENCFSQLPDEAEYKIVIGKPINSQLEDLSSSYQSAKEAKQYAFLMDQKKIISYSKEDFDTFKPSGSSHQVIKKVENYLRSCNFKATIMTINGLIEALIVGRYSIEYSRNTLQDIVSSIRRAFNDIGVDADSVLGYDMREYYKQLTTISAYRDWMNHILQILLASIEERRENENQQLLEEIKTIIDDNIFNDLSLDLVADKLNMRYDSLSRTFKNLTGKNFSTYVKGVKLEKANDLVLSGDYTVTQISSMLGYSSTHYFIQLFKEAYGTTPKRYQLKMNKKEK